MLENLLQNLYCVELKQQMFIVQIKLECLRQSSLPVLDAISTRIRLLGLLRDTYYLRKAATLP